MPENWLENCPENWIDAFPGLSMLEQPARQILQKASVVMTLPPESTPFRHGQTCDSYLFVVTGTVRVHMVSETGREIVLYRVEHGQTCILTTCCLMSKEEYPAEAVTETEVQAAILPEAAFNELLARSPVFRDFVFSTYGRRISDLMLLVNEVAFRNIDLRLSRLLVESVNDDGVLNRTHQDIAIELGTAREVVSRQLKEFERRSWVVLRRGQINVIDKDALRRLAHGKLV
jgi:CRP/FNR family transcriptional regulator